jgi:hypothetical protein
MTQAFNLSQFANKVNTSGQADLTTAVTGTLPVANGGTGAATLTSNNVLLGNGTSAVQTVAPGATGNVLQSNGTTWVSAASSGSYTNGTTLLYTSPATFTVPTGVTAVSVICIGGGGGGSSPSQDGGVGGTGWAYVSGLTPGSNISVTVGAGGTGFVNSPGGAGGTSSFGSYLSATGGGNNNSSGSSSASVPSGIVLGINSATMIPPWQAGTAINRPAPAQQTSITWSAAGGYRPGAGGGRTQTNNYNGAGGTSGIVVIQY